MRERFSAFAQSVSTQLGPRAARVGVAAKRAAVLTARVSRKALAAAKVGLDRTLSLIERALLSPRWRERLHAGSVFALIFAFGIASVDMLVAGGPELISSARAATAEAPRVDLIAGRSGGGIAEVQWASLDTETQTLIPEEQVALLTPTTAHVVAQPAAELPDLANAPSEPVKAQPEVRDAPDPRAKA